MDDEGELLIDLYNHSGNYNDFCFRYDSLDNYITKRGIHGRRADYDAE